MTAYRFWSGEGGLTQGPLFPPGGHVIEPENPEEDPVIVVQAIFTCDDHAGYEEYHIGGELIDVRITPAAGTGGGQA